ncbi:MAG: hypothetical protein Q4D26_11475 [Clostridia bacterium]|nr:hypothetical protein [Clostridia bacterium]
MEDRIDSIIPNVNNVEELKEYLKIKYNICNESELKDYINKSNLNDFINCIST